MIWVLAGVAVVLVVVIGLVVVGRETNKLRHTARPAVFDMTEAVEFIADRLPPEVASQLTHDDVPWILWTDVDLLEDVTAPERAAGADDEPAMAPVSGVAVVDPDRAVALILGRADEEERELTDAHVVAVLDGRMEYLAAIGAIGPLVGSPLDEDA